ncbi:hypothetical protein [Micromonospora halophytica]|uniref:DNA-3-methyladenine glycosylase II n=1 Tax=Micromonospora halophytica TaxID=47864 RepID=A0A1C5HD41_9ACTN|nr:hypothetical protein [Micromonospora halophytica]SCG43411.1 DNA-3-methyladenine glycosylase II [Micromonospora halophytica]
MSFDFLMTDHPAWRSDGLRQSRVLSFTTGTVGLITVQGTKVSTVCVRGEQPLPHLDVFSAPGTPHRQATAIHAPLAAIGTVARLRNPGLWEALATAIIRQVIRAGQARKLYRDFCRRFGEVIAPSDETDFHTFPSAERVLTLSDDDFTECGMAFKRRPLRNAATAFLAHGGSWLELSPSVLVKELQNVSGIGPWSAGAAVADWSNDWTLYPYADLAVRTWARHASPHQPWPADEPAFAREWRRMTGDHLATYTLLTLAYGNQHAGAL